MKWIALGLILLGAALVWFAMHLDARSSFDDGSFLNEMVVGLVGAVCIVVGFVIFGILVFLNL